MFFGKGNKSAEKRAPTYEEKAGMRKVRAEAETKVLREYVSALLSDARSAHKRFESVSVGSGNYEAASLQERVRAVLGVINETPDVVSVQPFTEYSAWGGEHSSGGSTTVYLLVTFGSGKT